MFLKVNFIFNFLSTYFNVALMKVSLETKKINNSVSSDPQFALKTNKLHPIWNVNAFQNLLVIFLLNYHSCC